jgi:hypothetical protein
MVSTPPEVIDQVQAQVEAFIEAIGAKEPSITGTLHKVAAEQLPFWCSDNVKLNRWSGCRPTQATILV